MGESILGVYAAASLVCFAAYGIDKWAAIAKWRRVPERHLQLLALAGGWPGGFLAQRLFRHKCSKPAFLRVFFLCAAANCAAVAVLVGVTSR